MAASQFKQIIVFTNLQRLVAIDGNTIVYNMPCVTGDANHPTPKGKFKILNGGKHRSYKSKTYNAQMNYAMFFTSDGVAIHESYYFNQDANSNDMFQSFASDTLSAAVSYSRRFFP